MGDARLSAKHWVVKSMIILYNWNVFAWQSTRCSMVTAHCVPPPGVRSPANCSMTCLIRCVCGVYLQSALLSCSMQNVLLSCSMQDSQDPNPLIRALAVRTMGCIRVDKITEYLCDPLQRCLKVRLVQFLTLSVTALQHVSSICSM